LRTPQNPLFENFSDNGISDSQTVSSHFSIRRFSTPPKQMEQSSMIDKGIGKEMLWIKFESEEVNGQTVYLNLNFCRFVEGIDFFEYSQFVCINVILSIECIFTGVDPFWSYFDPSLNLIFCCNLEMTFYCPKNMMIRNIDFIPLINTNEQKNSSHLSMRRNIFLRQFF
jgi:hypothetical protein